MSPMFRIFAVSVIMIGLFLLVGCYKQPISSFDEICFKESVKLCKVTLEIGR